MQILYRLDKCAGFVVQTSCSPGPKKVRCKNCQKARQRLQEKRELQNTILIEREKRKKLVTLCRNLNRKSERQKLKVNSTLIL